MPAVRAELLRLKTTAAAVDTDVDTPHAHAVKVIHRAPLRQSSVDGLALVGLGPKQVFAHGIAIIKVAPLTAVDAHVDAAAVVEEVADFNGAVVDDFCRSSNTVEEILELSDPTDARAGLGAAIAGVRARVVGAPSLVSPELSPASSPVVVPWSSTMAR